jgi:hypothetical protein
MRSLTHYLFHPLLIVWSLQILFGVFGRGISPLVALGKKMVSRELTKKHTLHSLQPLESLVTFKFNLCTSRIYF